MAAFLYKNTNIVYTPARPGTPGSAGQPYQPPRTYVESYEVCSYYELTPQEVVAAYAAQGVTVTWGIVGYEQGQAIYGYTRTDGGGLLTSVQTSGYRCRTEQRIVSIPAQPYIPPVPAAPPQPEQITYDYQLGWNARANSIPRMIADGRYSFRVPASVVGAVVGLTRNPQRSGYGDMLWAFYVTRDIVRIYEQGNEVANLGSNPNAVLSIERRKGRIVYKIDGATVRDTSNDSGPMMLSAALYSGGDVVQDAAYEDLNAGTASVSLGRLSAYGAAGVSYAIGDLVFPSMTASGSAGARGSASLTLGALQAFAADASGYAIGSATMAALSAEGDSLGAAPPYALASATILPMTLGAYGFTGTIGSGSATLQRLSAIGAEGGYAQASAVMQPMTAAGFTSMPVTEALMSSLLLCVSDSASDGILIAVMNSEFGIEALVSVQRIESGLVDSSITFDGTQITTQQLEALLESVMRASVSVGDPSAIEARSVWVLSLDAMGSTRYEGFDFNSFAEVNGRYFGMRSDGLYLLQGPDDNGQKIAARVNLGRPDMGSLDRKGLPYVYVGAASDGVLILKVVADGRTYYYRASGDSEDVKTHRFTPGLGLRATHYELEIQNDRGGAFDMANIEFIPVKLSRRI